MALSDRFHGIVILGAPGSGKGTQAKLISESIELPHISSGELLRANIANQTPLGIMAKGLIDSGSLVPDDVAVPMVRDRLMQNDCKRGFILDGFPRTIPQADALNSVLQVLGMCITLVPYLRVSERMLMQRLMHRLTCRVCGTTYSLISLSPGDACEKPDCGGVLFRRSDDDPDTQRKRIAIYDEQTAPLISYYAERHILKRVSGEHTVDYIFRKLLDAMRSSRTCDQL